MITGVVGSRDFGYAIYPYMALCDWQITKVVSGEARGPDREGKAWAKSCKIPYEPFPADWSQGKGAGYARNPEIVAASEALLAFWDGRSNGTQDTIGLARTKGIPVQVILPKDLDPLRITTFRDNYYFLSNMCPINPDYMFGYTSLEAAYHASKFAKNSPERAHLKTLDGYEAKSFAKGKAPADWKQRSVHVMETLMIKKFSDPLLAERLFCTGGTLIMHENTWGDVFWGTVRGVGQNQHGRLLMKIRRSL